MRDDTLLNSARVLRQGDTPQALGEVIADGIDAARLRIAKLEAENAALRRERDDAVRAAWAVRDLATPPISDADVERAVAEAKRVMEDLEDAGDPFQLR